MLFEEFDDGIWSMDFEIITEDPVHHVYISNTYAVKQCAGHFPKVTKLTFAERFDEPRDSTVIDLNRIIPLRQLTHLNLNCSSFSF
jgi:hypothetical protein